MREHVIVKGLLRLPHSFFSLQCRHVSILHAKPLLFILCSFSMDAMQYHSGKVDWTGLASVWKKLLEKITATHQK